MDVILQQIEELSVKANAWLDFSLTCGYIALGLSLICAVWLILKRR